MENMCGYRIKERIRALDINQADLCRMTGISKATMSQYANGKYFPTQERLERIANALQTTPAYLMGWSDKVQDYDPLKDAKWDKVREMIPEELLPLCDIYNELDPLSRKQVIHYAEFLLSQKDNNGY